MTELKPRYIVLLLICVLAGFLLVTQFRADNSGKLYVSATAIDEYEAQIASEHDSIETIEMQIAETKVLLEEYEANRENSDNEVIANKLRGELADYIGMTGMGPVHGEGVRIVVDDGTRELAAGENINSILVHDIDIIMIVNELWRSKAEAIAINGHRITPYTSITCSGYTVRMDGRTYARPFEIVAIGDSKRISSALLASEGYGASLREWGVQFSLEFVEDIEIPAAEGIKSFKFALPAN